MLRRILQTKVNYAATIARLCLGVVMLPHGVGKVSTLFEGHGFTNTLNMFTQMLHIPWTFAVLAIITEFTASICLILGFFSRLAALGIGIIMFMAVSMIHVHNGFFMNWMQVANKGEGFEYHLLAIGLALVVIIRGGGAWSLDRAIAKK